MVREVKNEILRLSRIKHLKKHPLAFDDSDRVIVTRSLKSFKTIESVILKHKDRFKKLGVCRIEQSLAIKYDTYSTTPDGQYYQFFDIDLTDGSTLTVRSVGFKTEDYRNIEIENDTKL